MLWSAAAGAGEDLWAIVSRHVPAHEISFVVHAAAGPLGGRPWLCAGPAKVTLNLKNNGLLPREFKFLERYPAGKAINVFTAFLLPGQSYKAELRAGTALAQVTQPEINAAMRGQSVAGKLLLLVTASDNGRTVNLVGK